MASTSIDQRVAVRLQELIAFGEELLRTKKEYRQNESFLIKVEIDREKAYQWFTSAQNLLIRALGSDSAHCQNFSQINGPLGIGHLESVLRGQGILRAALDDFQHGYLFELRLLVEAELFADFLDQSRGLLKSGYHAPAAVLAGCVLEDSLRRLCASHQLALPQRPKLDQMNAELAKAAVYTKLVQKRITAIADIRNNAAHGNWNEFKPEDVEDSIDWIARFIEEHQR